MNPIDSMTSLEIATLTGKRHDNVISDIEKMLSDLELGLLTFQGSYKSQQNKELRCYNLNEELSITLVSGYNVKMRHAIIKRWQELEPKLPQSFAQALRLAAETQERVELLEVQAKIDAPKVKFADVITESANTRSVRYWVKAMKSENNLIVGERAVFKWLRAKEYIFKNENIPFAKYEVNGLNYFSMIVAEDERGIARKNLHITGQGMLKLTPKVLSYFAN